MAELKKIYKFFPSRVYKNAHLLTSVLLFGSILLGFFLINKQFMGPAYLSDEIGYLTKAATIAGHTVDGYSSWHAGYALLAAPAYILFSGIYNIWQTVLVLNAFMFTAGFTALFFVLRRLYPAKNHWSVLAITALCSIYPAWMIMSGYAFSTPAFVLLFVLSLLALVKVKEYTVLSIVPFSILVGALYWVHPIGLVAILAAFVCLAVDALYYRNYRVLCVYVVVSVAMLLLHNKGIQIWLAETMTPSGMDPRSHYSEVTSSVGKLLSVEFWLKCFVMISGHISYLLISTFGIAGYAAISMTNKVWTDLQQGKRLTTESRVYIYLLLSLIGVIVAGSLMFNLVLDNNAYGPDKWMYGRYSELILLPVLGIGLSLRWKLKYMVAVVAFVGLSGIALHYLVINTELNGYNNLINISSFWPYALFDTIGYRRWFLIAVLGIVVVWLLKKRLAFLVILPMYVLMIGTQTHWHHQILSAHSKPSDLVWLIRDKIKNVHCSGVYPGYLENMYSKERLRLYSYYLYDYGLQRMTPEDWLQGECGLYLTYDAAPFVSNESVDIIGREDYSGLYVIAKATLTRGVPIDGYKGTQGYYPNIQKEQNVPCVVKGCFDRSAAELKQFIDKGIYSEATQTIDTSGRAGVLFYGPYKTLSAGRYRVVFWGEFNNTNNTLVEVAAMEEEKIVKSGFREMTENRAIVPFVLHEDAESVEVRLIVEAENQIKIDHYAIEHIPLE